MSVNTYCKVIIGVKVDRDNLYTEQKKKLFDHDYPEDWALDPKTGKALWTIEHVPVDGVEFKYEGERIYAAEPMVAGYEVFAQSDCDNAFIEAINRQVNNWDGGSEKHISYANLNLDLIHTSAADSTRAKVEVEPSFWLRPILRHPWTRAKFYGNIVLAAYVVFSVVMIVVGIHNELTYGHSVSNQRMMMEYNYKCAQPIQQVINGDCCHMKRAINDKRR